MKQREPILRCEGLCKTFSQGRQSIDAVRGVDLTVFPGEVYGLVGESGCGKTTLGQLLVGLERPTAGRILLDGEDVTAVRGRRRRELCRVRQIIFQDPTASVDARKTIGWLLEEPLKIHRVPNRAARVSAMLQAVGLQPEDANRYPGELSGGQRQRIAIALALILEPKLVICDEPVSALDVSVQAQVLNLLLEFRQRLQLTYLFISHDLNVVSYLSDRIGVMYLGELVEEGTAEELVTHPQHPYTQALFSAALGQEDTLQSDVPAGGEFYKAGCPFSARCPHCDTVCVRESPAWRQLSGTHRVRCLHV